MAHRLGAAASYGLTTRQQFIRSNNELGKIYNVRAPHGRRHAPSQIPLQITPALTDRGTSSWRAILVVAVRLRSSLYGIDNQEYKTPGTSIPNVPPFSPNRRGPA